MSKVYSYEDCQPVIKEAFKKAIEFKMTCDLCGKVDGEGEFTEVMVNSQDLINICYDCHEKSNVEDEK